MPQKSAVSNSSLPMVQTQVLSAHQVGGGVMPRKVNASAGCIAQVRCFMIFLSHHTPTDLASKIPEATDRNHCSSWRLCPPCACKHNWHLSYETVVDGWLLHAPNGLRFCLHCCRKCGSMPRCGFGIRFKGISSICSKPIGFSCSWPNRVNLQLSAKHEKMNARGRQV